MSACGEGSATLTSTYVLRIAEPPEGARCNQCTLCCIEVREPGRELGDADVRLALEAAKSGTYRCGLTMATKLALDDCVKGSWATLNKIYLEAVQ